MERRRWNFAEILIKKVSILMAIIISRVVKSNKKKAMQPISSGTALKCDKKLVHFSGRDFAYESVGMLVGNF